MATKQFFKPIMTTNKDNIAKQIGQFIFDITEKQIYIDINDQTREAISLFIEDKDIKTYIDGKAQTIIEQIQNLETTLTEKINKVKPVVKSIVLSTESWVKEAEDRYKYNIVDESVLNTDLINGYLDLSNQNKLVNGYINAYGGGYNIYTTELPRENITMNVSIQHCA